MVEHPAPHRHRVPLAILIFEAFVGPVASIGLDEAAQAAVQGDYFEYGKKLIARRRKDIGMNTEVRSLGHDKDESDE